MKSKKIRFLSGLYDILEKIPGFLFFLSPMIKRYRLYLNYDIKVCSAEVMYTLLKIYAVSVPAATLIFWSDPSIFTFLTALFAIRFIADSFTVSSYTRLEVGFLKAFDDFLNIVRHNYFITGSVKTAIAVSENEAEDIMKGHIREIYRCLDSADPETEEEKYLNTPYHKYLKLFLTLSGLVEENGDAEDEKGSVFLNSCMHLKNETEEDIRFITEKKHRFSGLMYTAVLPLAAIPFIAMWGVSTIPSLNLFYYGYMGTIFKGLMFILTCACYKALRFLRDGDVTGRSGYFMAETLSKHRTLKKLPTWLMKLNPKQAGKRKERIEDLSEGYSIKTFYMLKALCFAAGFVISCLILYMGHRASAHIYRFDVPDVTALTSAADSRQIEALEKLIPIYTDRMIEEDILMEKEELTALILNEKDIRTEMVAEAAANEILKRIAQYENEQFGIIDIILAVAVSIICSFFPDIGLMFKNSVSSSRYKDEIIQFQSIIHMLKNVPGISTVSLLEEMERFSVLFKPVIRQCINDYNISDVSALNRMYEEKKDKDFRRIVDCFRQVSELGIEDAFTEISQEIVNFKENRKLDRKIMLDFEAMLGALMAVIPGGTILFGYLLGPFMIRSVQIFNEYQAGIAMRSM